MVTVGSRYFLLARPTLHHPPPNPVSPSLLCALSLIHRMSASDDDDGDDGDDDDDDEVKP